MPVDQRAAFAHAPALLCGELLDRSAVLVCSRHATHWKQNPATGAIRFLCHGHASTGDAAIVDGQEIVLVSVGCTVTIAGSSSAADVAVEGAIGRLRALLDAAGHRVRIGAAGWHTSRYYPSVGAVAGRGLTREG